MSNFNTLQRHGAKQTSVQGNNGEDTKCRDFAVTSQLHHLSPCTNYLTSINPHPHLQNGTPRRITWNKAYKSTFHSSWRSLLHTYLPVQHIHIREVPVLRELENTKQISKKLSSEINTHKSECAQMHEWGLVKNGTSKAFLRRSLLFMAGFQSSDCFLLC